MNNEIQFEDTEFTMQANAKIDFKQVIVSQIDHIRMLASQDMGSIALFDLNMPVEQNELSVIIRNIAKHERAVKALHSIMKTYHNDDYLESIKQIRTNYDEASNKAIKKIQSQYSAKNNRLQLEKLENDMRRYKILHATKHTLIKNELLFEELLVLIERAGFIGGNDLGGTQE